MTDNKLQIEIERNYEAFKKKLPELIKTHKGKYALMHKKKITEFYDTAHDAYIVGERLYGRGKFSIQEVTDQPVYVF